MHSVRRIPQVLPASVLILLIVGGRVAGQDPVDDGLTQAVPVRYSFSRDTIKRPNEIDENQVYADPGLQKLTDGQCDTSARRAVWAQQGMARRPGAGPLLRLWASRSRRRSRSSRTVLHCALTTVC